MQTKTNILIISPDFNISCGVSRHVFLLLKELKKNSNYNLFFITNGGDNTICIKNLGIDTTIFPFPKDRYSLGRVFSFFFFLLKFCRKHHIHIIHTHHRFPELVSWFISKFCKLKTITTVHSIVEGYRSFSFRSSKIICVSNYVKNNLCDKFCVDPSRIVVLYNFIDELENQKECNADSLKKELGLDEEAIILLYVGRINKIKGIDILIEAFKNVSQKIFRLVLVLVGELFPEEISVETLKQERIILLPPSLDIRKYYNLSNMVVLPSRREPLGLAMLEAGAMCKPFIGSNTGGISEFIENGVNGILVEHENPNDLAEAIERAIRDKELSENIAHNLKVKVRDECNARNYMEKLISIYKELLWEN